MMFFNHSKVRAYLVEHGEVFTIRLKKRREGNDLFVYGALFKDPIKIGKGEVRLVKSISFSREESSEKELTEFVNKSGFDSPQEWIEGFVAVNKGRIPKEAFVYHARLKRD